MDNSPDLSKVIGTIMKNPEIINMIKGLASTTEERNDSEKEQESATINDESEAFSPIKEKTVENESLAKKRKRQALLSAIKPYLSKERCKAVDTMLSVFDVLDVIKGG